MFPANLSKVFGYADSSEAALKGARQGASRRGASASALLSCLQARTSWTRRSGRCTTRCACSTPPPPTRGCCTAAAGRRCRWRRWAWAWQCQTAFWTPTRRPSDCHMPYHVIVRTYLDMQVVDEAAARTPGKRSLAMAAYARSLRAIPTIISDNAGAWSDTASGCAMLSSGASYADCVCCGCLLRVWACRTSRSIVGPDMRQHSWA
jgi:hypothetical protein